MNYFKRGCCILIVTIIFFSSITIVEKQEAQAFVEPVTTTSLVGITTGTAIACIIGASILVGGGLLGTHMITDTTQKISENISSSTIMKSFGSPLPNSYPTGIIPQHNPNFVYNR